MWYFCTGVSDRPRSWALLAPRVTGLVFACGLALAPIAIAPIAIASSAPAAETTRAATEADTRSPAPHPGRTFAEAVTVTASRSEQTIGDTPGTVSVIRAEEIEALGHDDLQDVLLFEPGVYADNDVTRLGLGGLNIRGIGENRVLTTIDGVATAERFDFGPFTVQQFVVDVDALESVEIVRSAGSSLYGSDALGGVVSLVTRDPSSYLSQTGGGPYVAVKIAHDGRDAELRETGTVAVGNDRWQTSLHVTHRDGEALDNQGHVDTEDPTRTRPNPIDRSSLGALAKLTHQPKERSNLEFTVEWFGAEAQTQVLSGQGTVFGTRVVDLDAVDTQDRLRVSIEHNLQLGTRLIDTLFWRAHGQNNETEQRTDETRLGFRGTTQRDGLVRFEQGNLGGEIQLQKGWHGQRSSHLLTYGVHLSTDTFDGLRDRSEFDAAGQPVPTSLIFPTKYFPETDVRELGIYLQDEITVANGRARIVPGVRFDDYDLDARADDAVFLSGNPGSVEPADLSTSSVSPKLGLVLDLGRGFSFTGHYGRGFRAPPYSAVNNGFTNFGGGYRTLPNPELEAETSDNVEIGLRGAFRRGSFSVVAFDNQYDDFIETASLGFDPILGLVEFQPRNVSNVTISGLEARGDVLLGNRWSLRASLAIIEGENDGTNEPLLSIEPAKLVVGATYRALTGRWGGALTTTFVESKAADATPEGQFRTPSYALASLSAWVSLTDAIGLQATIHNLTDETYWTWPNVRGRPAGDPVIDRFSSPGVNASVALRLQF